MDHERKRIKYKEKEREKAQKVIERNEKGHYQTREDETELQKVA
jgi:hypothetical protein